MGAWRVAARTRRRQNALNHPNATLQTCPRRPVGKPAARVQMGPAARPATPPPPCYSDKLGAYLWV